MINAVTTAGKLRHKELHEIPLSLLACQQAEVNRDRKKMKKPYTLADFYCYAGEDEVDSIDAAYGTAAKALIDMNRFPSWALFAYKDLMKNAGKGRVPNVLCYIGEDAMILAPKINEKQCVGMLIATESASSRVVELKTLDGLDEIRIRVPILNGKVVAIENCYLDIV